MTAQLPSEGPDREIFVRALRDFSVACEMPELTPHCPFYEMTLHGPSCGEQCMDILAAIGDTDRSEDVFDIGSGYKFHGRQAKRPRRGPQRDSRPYDARAFAARDADKPLEQKHLSSVLGDLVSSLVTSKAVATDSAERSYRIRSSVDELRRRGFSPEDLVRYGFGMQIAFGIVFQNIVLPRLVEQVDMPIELATPDPRWVQLFETRARSAGVAAADESVIGFAMSSFARQVFGWVQIADLTSIENWDAPESLDDSQLAPVDHRRSTVSTWLVERFLLTYLDDWSTPSLNLEWLYLHGEYSLPLPGSIVRERQIDASEVAKELANRSAVDWKQSADASSKSEIRVEEFARIAIDNLAAGRRQVAISVYSGLAQLCPDNAEVRNNYGFCLIPDDPETALSELSMADRLGYHAPIINAANRVLVLFLLGRHAEALSLSKEVLERCAESNDLAWLWDFASSSNELVLRDQLQDVKSYVEALTLRIESIA